MLCCIPIKVGLSITGLATIGYFIINPIINAVHYYNVFKTFAEGAINETLTAQGVYNEVVVGILFFPGILAAYYYFRWFLKDEIKTRKGIIKAAVLTGVIPVLTFVQ